MKPSLLLRFAASILVLGFVTTGCKNEDRPTTASAVVPRADIGAAKAADAARVALGADRPAQAVTLAEQAVALQPRDAGYRALLGQCYLAAGRFASAATSLRDARALDPAQTRAGLNLALAEIALGDRAAALAVLGDIKGQVNEADRGLAVALAGDPDGAVRALESAARAEGADARTRQNLALAHALAGQWGMARRIASQDLVGDALEQRMRQWAQFSQPSADWQQVATLLNVAPVQDAGQPVALALAAEPATPIATVAVAAAAPAPEAPAVAEAPVPASTLVAQAVPAAFTAAPVPASAPAPLIHAAAAQPESARIAAFVRPVDMPIRTAPVPTRRRVQPQDGRFVIQLGAYSSAARVEAGWRRKVARFHRLADYTPSSGSFVYRGATLHRLTLAGFGTRAEATGLCGWLKTKGGDCFVRAAAGERIVRLAPGAGTELAAR
jgi:Flp pilus assembly protein TadD